LLDEPSCGRSASSTVLGARAKLWFFFLRAAKVLSEVVESKNQRSFVATVPCSSGKGAKFVGKKEAADWDVRRENTALAGWIYPAQHRFVRHVCEVVQQVPYAWKMCLVKNMCRKLFEGDEASEVQGECARCT